MGNFACRSAVVGAALLCATLALAQEYRLKALPGSSQIIVWRSKAAHDEALSLINAGVHKSNPALVYKLVACMAEPGTKVIVTDMGFVTHDIMVIEGDSSGCRGNIPAEELDSRR